MTTSAFRHPAVVALMAMLASAGLARADQIDRVMVEESAGIAETVRGLKTQNVAVLKFQVKLGDAPASFEVGTAGTEMLHRMENLLILRLNPDKPEYTVLSGAGEAAAALAASSKTAIDWTTAEGRKKLFDLKLPVIWNENAQQAPEAFVTGTLLVAKDFSGVKIQLHAFTKGAPEKLLDLQTLTGPKVGDTVHGIWMDRAMLASLGQTFSTSASLKKTDQAKDLFAADESAVADVTKRAFGTLPAARVKLDIFIDSEAVALEPDSGSSGSFRFARKNPPRAGQKVTFRLENTTDKKLAVLLCVNGQNLIAIDRENPINGKDLAKGENLAAGDAVRSRFRMFVLEPKSKYDVPGYLMNVQGTVREVVVAPDDVANQLFWAMDPRYRGKIQMFVYGQALLDLPPITKSDATTPVQLGHKNEDVLPKFDMALDTQGLSVPPKVQKTQSAKAAKESVAARTGLAMEDNNLKANPKARSVPKLFVPGAVKPGQPLREIEFQYDERPLDSLVITYHNK